MAFCSNCGHQLADGVNFCSACGNKVEVSHAAQDIQRKTVYEGEIHKCPQCGEVIHSFVSICPACGLELSGKNDSESFLSFIEKVDVCERQITCDSTVKSGWASWSNSAKIWWVVLNIFCTCIPLVIYAVWPLITTKVEPKLSPSEKQLASLIQNFPFPNDRKTVLAALVYIKEKISFASKGKIDRKSVYWMKLWCTKAEQLKAKSDMLFPNDEIVNRSYIDILNNQTQFNKVVKKKAALGIAIILAVSIFITVVYITSDGEAMADNGGYDITSAWTTNDLLAQLPQPDVKDGQIIIESNQQINFELYSVDKATFESYVQSCKDAGFDVNISKTDMTFCATNAEGYTLSIFYYSSKEAMNVVVTANNIQN